MTHDGTHTCPFIACPEKQQRGCYILHEGQIWIGIAETARATAEAAARLSRADLATSLVTELTGLAGTMGRHYALQCGVQPEVAEASLHKAAHV